MVVPLICAKVPHSIASIALTAVVMMLDAAVFTSTSVKRIVLVFCIVLILWIAKAVIAHLDSMNESKSINKPENRLCYSLIYSGCTSALDIVSGMLKTVTLFFMKMLYHNLKQPSAFMMLSRSVEYTLTTKEEGREYTAEDAGEKRNVKGGEVVQKQEVINPLNAVRTELHLLP